MAVHIAGAGDFLTLSEGKSTLQNPVNILEMIQFTEAATTSNKVAGVIEQLQLAESSHDPDIAAQAIDTLSFFDQAARGPHASAFDLFGMFDLAGLFHGGNNTDTLVINESVTANITKPGIDALAFTELADNRINPFLAITDDLSLYETATGLKGGCSVSDQRSDVQFIDPMSGYILTLIVPDFGDIRRRDFQRINRRSRANDLVVYRDPTWVKSDNITIKLSHLNEYQKYNLINFLEFNTGHIVQYRDYENNLWQGFIMNPSVPFIQTAPCTYECEIQFSGGIIQNG